MPLIKRRYKLQLLFVLSDTVYHYIIENNHLIMISYSLVVRIISYYQHANSHL